MVVKCRRMVAARSNCSRIGVERRSHCSNDSTSNRIIFVTTALWARRGGSKNFKFGGMFPVKGKTDDTVSRRKVKDQGHMGTLTFRLGGTLFHFSLRCCVSRPPMFTLRLEINTPNTAAAHHPS